MNFPLVGVQFRSAEEKATFANLQPEDGLLLQRDPENPYDPNAIKVLFQIDEHIFHHIGFIAAVYAKKLSPLLEEQERSLPEEPSAYFPAWFVTAVDKKSGIISCDFSVD